MERRGKEKNIYYFSYVHKTIIEYYLKNKKVNLLQMVIKFMVFSRRINQNKIERKAK